MQRYYIVVSHFPNGHYMYMYIVTTYMYMYVYIPVHVYGCYMLSIMYHCRTAILLKQLKNKILFKLKVYSKTKLIQTIKW